MRIRPAIASDAAVLAALAERTFRDTFAASNTTGDMAAHVAASYAEDKQRAEIESTRIRTLIAESEGVVAGYAQLRLGEPPQCVDARDGVELWRFYIDKAWIGRGLAPRLMEAVIAAGRSLGAPVLWLGVWERNPRAIAFYRKFAFVEAGSHVFQLGADAQTDLIMQRSL